ncbi:hypothetical protein ABBQ38_014861 [Trebouxia sp. C0009 RCD-2024]
MILIWTVGDVCNLAGVFLTKALPTQVYMAVLFAVLDILLNFQHCWYCYWIVPRRKKRQAAQLAAAPAEGTPEAEVHDSASEVQLASKTSESQKPLIRPVTDLPQGAASMTDDAKTSSSQESNTVSTASQSGGSQQDRDTELTSMDSSSSNFPSAQDGIKRGVDDHVTGKGDAESREPGGNIPAAHQLRALSAGLMLVGCGIMTTSVPTMITAGLTGTLPGASDFRSTSGVWSQQRASTGRVLLSGGANAATGKTVDIGQGLGWGMTVTYLAARVPQILKNLRRGTTEGLSFFMFALLFMGSVTYVLSIFIRSVESQFIVPKLPWLIEALGAILLDGTIVVQILYYRSKHRNQPPPALPASDLPLGSIAP